MEPLATLWPQARFRAAHALVPLVGRLPLPQPWLDKVGLPVEMVAARELPARVARRHDLLDGSAPARLELGEPVTVELEGSLVRSLCHAAGDTGAPLAHDRYRAEPPSFVRVRQATLHPRWGLVQVAPGRLLVETVHATRWFHPSPSGLPRDPRRGGGPLPGFVSLRGHDRTLPDPRPRRLDGPHLLLGHWAAHNFGHFHMDCLPGPLLFADELRDGRLSLVSGPLTPWQRALLARLGLPERAVHEVADDRVEVEDLVVPLSLDCRYTPNAHPVHRQLFAALAASARGTGEAPARIYVNRSGAEGRRVMRNERELCHELSRRGFVSLDPSSLPLDEQARFFSRAEAVVGAVGAGLTNLGYAPPGCAVVEILAAPVVETWVAHLCAVLGHRFAFVVAPLVEGGSRSFKVGALRRTDVLLDYQCPIAPTLHAIDALLAAG